MFGPDICNLPLSQHLYRTLIEVAPGSLLGVLGIWGWGLLYERLILPAPKKVNGWHAFVEGTVIVASLRLLSSIAGIVHSSSAIAAVGVFFIFVLALNIERTTKWNWISGIGLLLAVLFGLQLISVPLPVSDVTAIWGYHAKALTCESLFHADYVREAYWTGTHPEYPLYQPFLYSFFFALNHSFRDDVIKIWIALSVIALVPILFTTLEMHVQSRVNRLLIVISLVMCLQNKSGGGAPELCSAIFSLLIASSLLRSDWRRLPLYLFGLATTKNEGTVSALVLVVLTFWPAFRKGQPKKLFLTYAVASAVLIFAWAGIASRLPSRHEQYQQRLLDPRAWLTNIGEVDVILAGYAKYLLSFPWGYVVGMTLIATIFFRKKWIPAYHILRLWPLAMLGIFFCIYLVTPFGSRLYEVTLNRLLTEVMLPALLVAGMVVFTAPGKWQWCIKALWICLLVIPAFVHHWKARYEHWPAKRFPLEYSAGMKMWDEKLPVFARVAYLNATDMFTPNYRMYPRKLYVCAPDDVAGTWRGTNFWTNSSQVNTEKDQLDHIIDGEAIIWRAEKP